MSESKKIKMCGFFIQIVKPARKHNLYYFEPFRPCSWLPPSEYAPWGGAANTRWAVDGPVVFWGDGPSAQGVCPPSMVLLRRGSTSSSLGPSWAGSGSPWLSRPPTAMGCSVIVWYLLISYVFSVVNFLVNVQTWIHFYGVFYRRFYHLPCQSHWASIFNLD